MNFYDVKEDWAGVKKRWEAWWNFDMHDRPLLQVTAAKNNPSPPPELEDFRYEETDLRRKWTDAGYIIAKTLHEFYRTYYGGESMPVLSHGWSVGHALPFGCEPNFAPDTIWTDTVPVKKGGEYPEIRFDQNNRWWRMILDATEKACRASRQRYFVMPMWGNHAGDNLSMCRGSENLLIDLIENPGWVKSALQHVTDSMIAQFDTLHGLTPLTGLEGSVNYVNCWSPKKTHGFDCDFSCMISPGMFKDVFLPPLIETMRTVDHRIYHLDGVEAALHHLDTLLEVEEIDAFQWVPGEGRMEIMQWVPLLQKMQARKKSVLCYTSPDAVIPLIKELRSEGLCICAGTRTEDDARRLIESVERLYR